MVSGSPPFKGDSPVEIILSHLNKPIPTLSNIDKSVPVQFSDAIKKLMEKKPSRRFQHPREARLALESAFSSTATPAPFYLKPVTHRKKKLNKLFLFLT
jgi:serine/threonine protein kinase